MSHHGPPEPIPALSTARHAMTTATIRAGAKLQLPTGQWATLKTGKTVEVISERHGIYRVLLNGKPFSVDYKHVEVNA